MIGITTGYDNLLPFERSVGDEQRLLTLHTQDLVDHPPCLTGVAATEEYIMIQNMIEIVDGTTLLVPRW